MAGQLIQAASAGRDAAAELEATLFLQALEGQFGVDFLGFEAHDIRRKLDDYVARAGVASASVLQGQVLRDAALGADVICALSQSGASALGENFHLMALRCSVLPILRSSPWPAIWLADCSDVRLLVLLLVLLKEEGLLERTRIFMTSSSEQALAGMQQFALSADEVALVHKLHRASGGKTALAEYLVEDGAGFVLDAALRTAVSAHVHHLGTDASFREFHAIIAARPLTEYGDALRERALRVFSDSLCPFGVLQLDDVQCARPPVLGERFVPVLPAYGIYRRIA